MKSNSTFISYLLLVINIIFWLVIASYFFFKFAGHSAYLFLKILLFLEPLCFLFILIGFIRRNKIVYFLGLIFLLLNSGLSLTDEVGLLDLISFGLSLGLFFSLFAGRKDFYRPRI